MPVAAEVIAPLVLCAVWLPRILR